MIANYTSHAANERTGARWVRQFSTALHRSKSTRKSSHARRPPMPCSATGGLSRAVDTITASFIAQQTSRGVETT
jgi:hypothetical protein